MIRKTLSAALAVAVLSTAALTATAAPSLAGHKHHGHHGHHFKHKFKYKYVYNDYCFWKKVKVYGHYGWHWEKVWVCR